jgi:hypothetical protein
MKIDVPNLGTEGKNKDFRIDRYENFYPDVKEPREKFGLLNLVGLLLILSWLGLTISYVCTKDELLLEIGIANGLLGLVALVCKTDGSRGK